MMEISISAKNTKSVIEQIQSKIGGEILERWGEYTLTVDSTIGKGVIRLIPFDWGVNLMSYDIVFFKEIIFNIEATEYNPIRFIFNLEGEFAHRFETEDEEELIEQFQTLIFSNKTDGQNYLHFKKDMRLNISIIQIVRKQFLKKRTTNVSTLNKKLHEVFEDTNHKKQFAHHGSLNLKMADQVRALHKIKSKGMLKIMKMEAKVYEILSLHIQQYNTHSRGVALPTSLSNSELKRVRKISKQILKTPSKDYSLDGLSFEAGMSQSKLQDGFKFLYAKTVTEYIRHVRLEMARDLLKTTDLNISQIVYTIGFTSRSYFSKIFKEKYSISPNQFKKQITVKVVAV